MARKAASHGTGSGAVKATLGLFVVAVLGVTALPVTIVVLAGMVPTAVAWFVDRDPGRHLSWTVGLLNVAGLVAPLLKLCGGDFSLAGTQQVLMNGQNWLFMYGGAGMGWLVDAAMPPVARVILDIGANREERRLLRRAEELVKAFGREVGGR